MRSARRRRHDSLTRQASVTKDLVRLKWALIGMVVWIAVLSILAELASHDCIVPGLRSAIAFDFEGCAPKLLAGGPVDLFLLVWAYVGGLSLLAVFAYTILRLILGALRD